MKERAKNPNSISPYNTFCCKDGAEFAFAFQTYCNFLFAADFIAFRAYFQYKSMTEPICLVAIKSASESTIVTSSSHRKILGDKKKWMKGEPT